MAVCQAGRKIIYQTGRKFSLSLAGWQKGHLTDYQEGQPAGWHEGRLTHSTDRKDVQHAGRMAPQQTDRKVIYLVGRNASGRLAG